MEIKAELQKPYTEAQRMDFIVEQNHNNGFIIEEQETKLVAMGLTQEEIAQKREATFKSEFFEIPAIEEVFIGGWFRKKPKGYSSAVESLNTAFNMVSVVSSLPADTLLFYTEPDFTDETQCNEEWLTAHSFYNTALTAAQFGQLYTAFMTAWNSEEHEA